jgi:CBS domain containing-hemolysin-like protein
MTPRTRLRTVSALAPVTTVIAATRETGHSRFPVIGDSIDDIRGVVHVKQAVAVREPDPPLSDHSGPSTKIVSV